MTSKSLLDFITGSRSAGFDKPLSIEAVRALQESTNIPTKQLQATLDELRNQPFNTVGYVPLTLAYLYLSRPDRDHEVDLSHLFLQGPAHETSTPIPADIQLRVQDILLKGMEQHFDKLIAQLAALPKSSKSCYQGGDRYWSTARAWAYSIKTRANLTQALPQDAPWRYEDILDASITDATTDLLTHRDQELQAISAKSASPHAEITADIWDGINDGNWDQVVDGHNYLDAFIIPTSEKPLTLHLAHSHLERARFGVANLKGWNLEHAEVLLADLRSATSITEANWGEVRWWTALLPPAVRYELSRHEEAAEFKAWGSSPPWHNPYHTQPWPVPLG